MRYEAYRFEEKVVGIGVRDGWVVRGQRSDTLNWQVLAECKTREEAEATARELRGTPSYYCPIFDPSGYAIKGTY
jgi:hypothetical protein